jgi:hypothetical protein
MLAAQISERMRGSGLILMWAATSIVRADMNSITVMLSTNAERNPATKGKRMNSFSGSSFTHFALCRPSHRKNPDRLSVSMMAIIPKMKRIVSQFSYRRRFSGPSTNANASRAPTMAAMVRFTFSEMMRP